MAKSKYGVARNMKVYDFDTGEESEHVARPSAWTKASIWTEDNEIKTDAGNDVPDAVEGVMSSYVWLYFALEREGLLSKYNLPETLTQETVMQMMDRFSVEVEEIQAPLPAALPAC